MTGGEARQGEIILKSPTRKAVFVGGLVLAAVATLLFYLV
ncbi:MAG: peptide ABC transporter permease [Kiloniellaceae bacterium]|nr:peptide ABC transporter permease [Kiloniellaceae bacterium]